MKKQDVQQPSIGDLTENNRQLFNTAGSDVPPVKIEQNPNFFENEIERLKTGISRDAEWDIRVKSMRRLMGLINSGVLENDYFRRNLIVFYSDISTAITNLRSALVKQSCLLVSQLSRELGTQFESIGDYFVPLSAQLSHGTQIISESCYFTLLNIAKNCPSKRILFSIFDLSGANSNNAANVGSKRRAVAAECLRIVVENWDFSLIESNWDTFQKVVISLLSDSSAEAREQSRQTVRLLMNSAPKRANQILSQLDDRTKKFINSEPSKQESPVKYSSYKSKRASTSERAERMNSKKSDINEHPKQTEGVGSKKSDISEKFTTNSEKSKDDNSIKQEIPNQNRNQIKITKSIEDNSKQNASSIQQELSSETSNEKPIKKPTQIPKVKSTKNDNAEQNSNSTKLENETRSQPKSLFTKQNANQSEDTKTHANEKPQSNETSKYNDNIIHNSNDRIIQTAKSNRNEKDLNSLIHEKENQTNSKQNRKPNPVIYRPISQKDQKDPKSRILKVNQSQHKEISPNINNDPIEHEIASFDQKKEKKRSMMPVFKPKTPVPSAQKAETDEYYHPHPPSTADSSQAVRQRNFQRYRQIDVKKIKRNNNPPVEKPELSFGPATDPNRQQYAVSHEYDHPPQQKVKPKTDTPKQKKQKTYTVVDLSEGNEMEFLESVENVYQQKTEDLIPKLPTIAAGILNCITSQKANQKTKEFGILVLDHIVYSFPNIFSISILPKILPVIISYPEDNLNVLSIITNLSKNYQNDLLPVALQINIQKVKTTYYLCLLNDILANSTIPAFEKQNFISIMNIIMDIAYTQTSTPEIKRYIKSIIKKINDSNNEFVSQYLDSYENSSSSFNRTEFENLYVNELQIPKYNQNRASFKKAVLDAVTNDESDLTWNEFQEEIYKQLALSLRNQSTNGKILKDNILIIKTIIETHGIDTPKNKIGFEIIVEELFSQISIGNKNEIFIKSFLNYMASSINLSSICSLLTKTFTSHRTITDESSYIWLNGLNLLAESIQSSNGNPDILKEFEKMMPFLKDGVESSTVEIRQISFQCFVNLKLNVNEKADLFISQLPEQHQKLISFMYNRCK